MATTAAHPPTLTGSPATPNEPVGTTAYAHPLPPRVAARVELWRDRLLEQANGRVLDLDLPAARAEVLGVAPQGFAGGASPEPYDTIVSTMQLARFADLATTMRALAALLAPSGTLRMLEPVHHFGRGHRITATLWSAHPAVRGLHLERDPIAVGRLAGLTCTDLQRMTMPTAIRPLQTMVAAIAHHTPPMDFDTGDER